MIIKKVLTAGGVGVIGARIVHGLTKNRMYCRILIPDKLIEAEYG